VSVGGNYDNVPCATERRVLEVESTAFIAVDPLNGHLAGKPQGASFQISEVLMRSRKMLPVREVGLWLSHAPL
jgi:hypothetical protein